MEENNKVKQVDEDIEYNQMIKTIDNLSDKIEELQERINKSIEYIRENCILSDCWEDLDFCNFVPVGRIKYKSLSSKKVKDLLDILKGKDNEK